MIVHRRHFICTFFALLFASTFRQTAAISYFLWVQRGVGGDVQQKQTELLHISLALQRALLIWAEAFPWH